MDDKTAEERANRVLVNMASTQLHGRKLTKIMEYEDAAYERAAEISQRHGNTVIAKIIRALKSEDRR